MAPLPVARAEIDPVVVGVDGSEHSKQALAWAARYAAVINAPLMPVTAWHLPTGYGWPLPIPDNWDPAGDARRVLECEVREVLNSGPPLAITVLVVQGDPGRVLVEASERASLVVVGTRGRGEFAGTLLGSVSEFVTTHAHCPVVVVHNRCEP